MTAQQQKELVRLRRRARKDRVKNFGAVCQFVDSNFRDKIIAGLFRASVPPSKLHDAYHDVLQRSGLRIYQLRKAKRFPGWLRRISKEIAKKHWPAFIKPANQPEEQKSTPQRPKQIGTKRITVDGKIYKVKVFEAYKPQEQVTWRQARLVNLSDITILRMNKSDYLDYPPKIDVWKAVSMLPNRWAKALLFVCVEGRTASEAAERLGCKVQRIHRLVQKGKQRMRELLPEYNPYCTSQPEPQTKKLTLHPLK